MTTTNCIACLKLIESKQINYCGARGPFCADCADDPDVRYRNCTPISDAAVIGTICTKCVQKHPEHTHCIHRLSTIKAVDTATFTEIVNILNKEGSMEIPTMPSDHTAVSEKCRMCGHCFPPDHGQRSWFAKEGPFCSKCADHYRQAFVSENCKAIAEKKEFDPVTRPKHYNDHPSGIECIEVTRWLSFNLGNAIKYVWRAGNKDPLKIIEDLKKAIWYINDEINRIEDKCGKKT